MHFSRAVEQEHKPFWMVGAKVKKLSHGGTGAGVLNFGYSFWGKRVVQIIHWFVVFCVPTNLSGAEAKMPGAGS